VVVPCGLRGQRGKKSSDDLIGNFGWVLLLGKGAEFFEHRSVMFLGAVGQPQWCGKEIFNQFIPRNRAGRHRNR